MTEFGYLLIADLVLFVAYVVETLYHYLGSESNCIDDTTDDVG